MLKYIGLTSIPFRLFGQQLLDLFGEMTFSTPNEADESEDHEHGDQSQPERFLQHSIGQRLVRNAIHFLFAPLTFPPGVATTEEASVSIETLATAFARIRSAWLLLPIASLAHVPQLAGALEAGVGQQALAENARVHLAHAEAAKSKTEYILVVSDPLKSTYTGCLIGGWTNFTWLFFGSFVETYPLRRKCNFVNNFHI